MINTGNPIWRRIAPKLYLETSWSVRANQQDLLPDQLFQTGVSFILLNDWQPEFKNLHTQLLGESRSVFEFPFVERKRPKLLLGNNAAIPSQRVFQPSLREEIAQFCTEGAVLEFDVEDTAALGFRGESQFVHAFAIRGIIAVATARRSPGAVPRGVANRAGQRGSAPPPPNRRRDAVGIESFHQPTVLHLDLLALRLSEEHKLLNFR